MAKERSVSTKVVKLDIDVILKSYNKPEFWKKEWLIYKSNIIVIYARIYSIDVRRNNESKIKRDGFHYDIYIYDINECFEEINNYIELLKDKIIEYETQLKNANKYIEKADKIINEIKELRKENELMSGISNNSLGYAIIEYIKNNV